MVTTVKKKSYDLLDHRKGEVTICNRYEHRVDTWEQAVLSKIISNHVAFARLGRGVQISS